MVAVGAVAAAAYGAAAMRNFLLDEDFDRFAAVPPPPARRHRVLARPIPEKGVRELIRSSMTSRGW